MILPPVSMAPVVAISAVSGLVLIAAWKSFGRLPHALTWAAAFLLLAMMWLATALVGRIGPGGIVSSSAVGGVAIALGAVGFRQRAKLLPRMDVLLYSAGLQAAVTGVLAAVDVGRLLLPIPLYLQGLAMLVVSERTLLGRRRSERIAEQGILAAIVAAALWLLARIGKAIGLEGHTVALCAFADLVQPLVMMVVGLFAIFLIAADLADRMRRHAATDRLTGLLNRRGLDEALTTTFAGARRRGQAIAMVIADIDRFKSINDRYGHPIGDAALCAFAACVSAGTARRDLVARIGGEEFAIVLVDVDGEAARCAAEVLREKVAALRLGGDGSLRITASFGIAPASADDLASADPLSTDWPRAELLARADRALYRSKAHGRNRVTVIH